MLNIRTMKNILSIGLISLSILITSCDPGHGGIASIDNKTKDTLILKYQTRYTDTTIIIPAMEKLAVLRFGGLGEARMYPGALVEFKEISLSPFDTTKLLTKEITNPDNWEMINENKIRFSNREIECWFTILSADIQKKRK